MIDRASRDQLALALRRLGSGRLSLSDFEQAAIRVERNCNPADRALRILAREMHLLAWSEDDHRWFSQSVCFWRLRSAPPRMTPSGKRFVARHWLFLKSDRTECTRDFLERKPLFEAPAHAARMTLAEVNLCGPRQTRLRHLRRLRRAGEQRRTAPFTTSSDLHAARAHSIYFRSPADATRSV